MAILIKDEDLSAAQLTENELRLEIAVLLYQKARFSLGKASRFAGMNRILFQKELGKRKIPVNYESDDLNEDLESLGITTEPNDNLNRLCL